MSRYSRSIRKEDRPWKIHPVWRGIGCLWFILLPIMSYAGAWLLVRYVIFTSGFRTFLSNLSISTGVNIFPPSLYNKIVLPSLQIGGFYFDFNVLIRWIPGYPFYNMDFLFWAAFVFIGFGVGTLVYALLYRSFGPPKSPYEAVEERYQRGPYG